MRGPLYYTLGFPIALASWLCRVTGDRLHPAVAGLVRLIVAGPLLWPGLALYRRRTRSPFGRVLQRAGAWLLCLGAFPLVFALLSLNAAEAADRLPGLRLVTAFFLFLLLSFVATLWDIATFNGFRACGRAHPAYAGYIETRSFAILGRRLFRRPYRRWYVRWPGRAAGLALQLLGLLIFLLIGWVGLFTLPPVRYAVFAFPAALLDLVARAFIQVRPGHAALRYGIATGFVGRRSRRVFRRRGAAWDVKLLAWFGCLAGLLWFIAAGWLALVLSGPVLGFLAALPIRLTQVLEWLYRRAMRPDWYTGAFVPATLGLGWLGLYLVRRPKRAWVRVLAWPLGWVCCLLGLLWFAFAWGFMTFLLTPLLRQGRHLETRPLDAPVDHWRALALRVRITRLDRVTLAIILVVLVLLIAGFGNLHPFAPDCYYHLLVAQRIVETGAVPLWDDWQYAPSGRHHLYAPGLHVLLAVLSAPFGGDVVFAHRLLQVSVLPLALLTTWYMLRRLFDERRAFAGVLLAGVDFGFAMLALFALPSILANALLPLAFVMFLRRRFIASALLVAAILYIHPGVGTLATAGLALFALIQRSHRRFGLLAVAAGVVLALPWYAHMAAHAEWLGNPMDAQFASIHAEIASKLAEPLAGLATRAVMFPMKLFWLMMANVVLLVIGVRGMRLANWRDPRYRILGANLAAFLVMLWQYGGRFFMHTAQVWASFGAVALAPLLTGRWRRQWVVTLILLALLPTLMFGGMGQGPHVPRFMPWFSGWSFLVFPAIGGDSFITNSYTGFTEVKEELAEYIVDNTSEDQIIHVMGDINLGVILAFHTGRPTDTAAWPEVRPVKGAAYVNAYAETDPEGVYVSRDPGQLPDDLSPRRFGSYYVAIRGGPVRLNSPR